MSTEHVFYVSHAYTINVKDKNTYSLWLADHTNIKKIDAILNGTAIPLEELVVEVRRDYTLEAPGPQQAVNFLDGVELQGSQGTERRKISDLGKQLPIYGPSQGRIAISEALWNSIPAEFRPLPRKRNQDYRLRLVAVTDDSSSRKFYMGFHAIVLDVDTVGKRSRVQFFSWIDQVLGDAWIDHASWTSSNFLPEGRHSTLSAASPPLTEGALFVFLDTWYTLPTVSFQIPKVPYGSGQ